MNFRFLFLLSKLEKRILNFSYSSRLDFLASRQWLICPHFPTSTLMDHLLPHHPSQVMGTNKQYKQTHQQTNRQTLCYLLEEVVLLMQLLRRRWSKQIYNLESASGNINETQVFAIFWWKLFCSCNYRGGGGRSNLKSLWGLRLCPDGMQQATEQCNNGSNVNRFQNNNV